jgi:hypothetical protein
MESLAFIASELIHATPAFETEAPHTNHALAVVLLGNRASAFVKNLETSENPETITAEHMASIITE